MTKMAKTTTKTKKKKWYPIVAPKIFNQKVIGESYVYEPDAKVGATVSANLMSMTNDIKSQNINVKFKIIGYKEGQLTTEIIRYGLIPSSMKRIVRRRQDRLDQIYKVKSKDGKVIRIKVLLVTRSRTTGSVHSALREAMGKLVKGFVSSNLYEDIFTKVVFYKLQREAKSKLKKIYPIRSFEVRILEKVDIEDMEGVEEVLPIEAEETEVKDDAAGSEEDVIEEDVDVSEEEADADDENTVEENPEQDVEDSFEEESEETDESVYFEEDEENEPKEE